MAQNSLLSHSFLSWKSRWARLNSLHKVSPGWHQVLASLGSIWRLWENTCSQAYSGCSLNSVPWSCGTEVPDSLLTPSSKGSSAFPGTWHPLPSKSAKTCQFPWCFKSHWPFSVTNWKKFSTSKASYDYIRPAWIIQDTLPVLKSKVPQNII